MLAVADGEEALHGEPVGVAAVQREARLRVDLNKAHAQRLLRRSLHLRPGGVSKDVDRNDVQVMHHEARRIEDACVELDERPASGLGRREVLEHERRHLDAEAIRAVEDDRFGKCYTGDARSAHRLAHLGREHAPVVAASQLDGDDGVQLNREAGLVHDGTCDLAEDRNVVYDQPARHLRLNLAATAERARQRRQHSKFAAAELEDNVGRGERGLCPKKEKLHVQVHLEVECKQTNRKVRPLRIRLSQLDLIHLRRRQWRGGGTAGEGDRWSREAGGHLHLEHRNYALHKGLADFELDPRRGCRVA